MELKVGYNVRILENCYGWGAMLTLPDLKGYMGHITEYKENFYKVGKYWYTKEKLECIEPYYPETYQIDYSELLNFLDKTPPDVQ